MASADPEPRTVILDFEAIPDIDTTATDVLRRVLASLTGLGVRLVVARPTPAVKNFMRREGVLAEIGEDNVFSTVVDAAAAVVGSRPSESGPAQPAERPRHERPDDLP